MWIDENLEFADAVAAGGLNGTAALVGDVVDLGSVTRDIGQGTPMYLVLQVAVAFTSGGAASVEFELASDAVEAIATDANQTTHWRSDTVLVTALVAGYTFVIPLPMGSPDYERYLGVIARETASQLLTAGSINAFLTNDPSGWASYADALPAFPG